MIKDPFAFLQPKDQPKVKRMFRSIQEENKQLKQLIEERNQFFQKQFDKFLKEETTTNTVLDMVKDENQVNKKNLQHYILENKKLNKQINQIVELDSLVGTQSEIDIQEILNDEIPNIEDEFDFNSEDDL